MKLPKLKNPITSNLNEAEQAWYDGLEECDHEKMRNAYLDFITSKVGSKATIQYTSFVKLCAVIAVKMHKTKSKRILKQFDKLEEKGKEFLDEQEKGRCP